MKRLSLFVIVFILENPLCSFAAEATFGHLNWGPLPVPGLSCQNSGVGLKELGILKSQYRDRLLKAAEQDLKREFSVIPVLTLQGHKASEPKHQESVALVGLFSHVLNLTLCSRIDESELGSKCAIKAKAVLTSWLKNYTPMGDPITENHFTELFQAIDLMRPLMTKDESHDFDLWILSFINAGDSFFESKMKGHGKEGNNWNTWRMAIRAVGASVLNDSKLKDETQKLIDQQIQHNFNRDAKGETDGRSIDFIERDALHYHTYDMQAWMTMVQLTPCLVSANSRKDIERGIPFFKPFANGTEKHMEFARSKISFDQVRAKDGDPHYQVHEWKGMGGLDESPYQALMVMARTAYPSTLPWTDSVINAKVGPFIQAQAKLMGEKRDF